MDAPSPVVTPPPTTPVTGLATCFERGNFAEVRKQANAVLADARASDEDRTVALDYRARTEPPGAARFALWVTLALVTILSVYFALVHKHA